MGAQIGACLTGNGHRTLWVADGRSAATRQRAQQAGLVAVDGLPQALAQAQIVLSVCPPHGAETMARDVAAAGFDGIYVDANAVAPATARRIGDMVNGAGKMRFVDGGIIGQPPRPGGRTRLYLAGDGAAEVATLFAGSPLHTVVLDAGVGAASVMKMCYAAWTKGATALLADIRALAGSAGVEDALLDEWRWSLPETVQRSEQASTQARKAWRWIGEMEEIADSFRAAGLPDGFHRAAADVYRRLGHFKDTDTPPGMRAVAAALRRDGDGPV